MGKAQYLSGAKGKATWQGKDHEVVAEGEEGALLGGAQGIVVHAGAPDVATGLAGQSVVDSTQQLRLTEGQQKFEDGLTQLVQVPSGLAEEAMKGAVVFEAGQLGGLNDVGQGAATGTEDPGAGQDPEGGETGSSEARLQGEQQRRKGANQEVRHSGARVSLNLSRIV
jgi:hypothetical protein